MAEQAHIIRLAGELGLRDAESLREQLLDALHAHPGIEVDTAGLTAVDMSIVQLFIAAQKMAQARSQTFQISAPADGPLAGAMSRAGLPTGSGGAPFDIHWQGNDAAS